MFGIVALNELFLIETRLDNRRWKGGFYDDALAVQRRMEGKNPQDHSTITMAIAFSIEADLLSELLSGKPVNVQITASDPASSASSGAGTISFDSAIAGIAHMTGTVIETGNGYRFVPDSNNTAQLRLTYLSPAGDAAPESKEVDLASYAGKRIRFGYLPGMIGPWVYGVNDIEEL